MIPRPRGVLLPVAVEAERGVPGGGVALLAADARRPRSSSMFRSWPLTAFVAGVTIGSGSRSDSRSPAGSAWPQT